MLVAPLPSDLEQLAAHPLVHEKLMPVLGLVRSPSVEHGIAACELVTEHGGLGHTSAIYATDEAVIERFAQRIRTGRILVNAPTAVGALGGIYNAMTPTFSLGCGTWGGSTTTDNVNYRNLLNVKAVSRRQAPPQWFRVPSDTYFNAGAIESLRTLRADHTMIVTDADTEARGAVDEVRRHLAPGSVRVFTGVEPEPTEEQIRAGVAALGDSPPDLIVAVGGGSVIDAAKTIRLFHESPGLTLRELTLPFLDARKRVAHYPELEHSIRLAAVPTTAGTGSEVSPAAVLTSEGRKLTLVDYSLVPDVAIVEPRLTLTMPPVMTADTGVDALTHALEAYVSIFASPFTDAFCLQAVHLILDALPRAVRDGDDLAARTDMANAATIAGLAFSNAFVGVNHALAHAVGARFGVAHGRANGLFLRRVLRYNAALPRKFMPAPGYGAYVAPAKLAQMAWVLGLGGHTEEIARERLFERVDARPGRGRHAAHGRGRRDRARAPTRGDPRPRARRLPRPEPADQPPDAAARRAGRAARRGLRRRGEPEMTSRRVHHGPGRPAPVRALRRDPRREGAGRAARGCPARGRAAPGSRRVVRELDGHRRRRRGDAALAAGLHARRRRRHPLARPGRGQRVLPRHQAPAQPAAWRERRRGAARRQGTRGLRRHHAARRARARAPW